MFNNQHIFQKNISSGRIRCKDIKKKQQQVSSQPVAPKMQDYSYNVFTRTYSSNGLSVAYLGRQLHGFIGNILKKLILMIA